MIYPPYEEAAARIRAAERMIAFTGAGISQESGIPTFSREDGLWIRYDPVCIEINNFLCDPRESWECIREIFYDTLSCANPGLAHYTLAEMEMNGYLSAVITQNIDNLHQEAGSSVIHEFHGTARILKCLGCGGRYPVSETDLCRLPPCCGRCGGVLKPDFVFFGESVSEETEQDSLFEIESSDLLLLIGTAGEVEPACFIPYIAKENGAGIIEINTEASHYTRSISDIFLQGPAGEMLEELMEILDRDR